ncbi:hypothetical protein [Streptomyces sp. NPDC001296]
MHDKLARDRLSRADFGRAHFGLRDDTLASRLAKAESSGIPFDPNARRNRPASGAGGCRPVIP